MLLVIREGIFRDKPTEVTCSSARAAAQALLVYVMYIFLTPLSFFFQVNMTQMNGRHYFMPEIWNKKKYKSIWLYSGSTKADLIIKPRETNVMRFIRMKTYRYMTLLYFGASPSKHRSQICGWQEIKHSVRADQAIKLWEGLLVTIVAII